MKLPAIQPLRHALLGPRGLVLILLVYAALYAPALSYGFVWDDIGTLKNNTFLDQPLGVVLRTSEHQRMGADEYLRLRNVTTTHESYRPVTVLSHWIDVHLFGHRPGPMHAHNLLLGALTLVLAWNLLRRGFDDEETALAGTWLLVVHPIRVEPYASISARQDLNVTLWALLSLNALLAADRHRGRAGRWVALGALFYALAFFAKESAVGLPAVLIAWLVLERRWTAAAVAGALIAAETLALVALRGALLSGVPMTHASVVRMGLWEMPAALRSYAATFLVPLDISNARPLLASHLGASWALLGLLSAGTLLGLQRAPRELRSELHRAVLGCVWVAIFLAPTALAARSLGSLSDRYACLALVGFAIALLACGRLLASRWERLRPALAWGFALWTGTLLVISWCELPAWRTDDALSRHAIEVEPRSAIAWYHFGFEQGQQGNWPRAATAFHRSTELDPTDGKAWNNFGVSLMRLGRMDAAEAAFHGALRATGGVWFKSWYNLSVVHRGRGESTRACDDLTRALSISPEFALALRDQRQYCSAAPRP